MTAAVAATRQGPRYLLVRLGSLGDVIHAIPAAAALRAHAPDAQIDWLVDPRYAGVVRMVRGVDRVIAVDPRGPKAELLVDHPGAAARRGTTWRSTSRG